VVNLLAELATEYQPPQSVDGLLAAIFYISGILGTLAAAYHYMFRAKSEKTPQPLVVSQHVEHVPMPVFTAHVQHTEKRFLDVVNEAKQAADVAAIGRSKIHQHIEASATETRAEISKIKDDVANLPERTITLMHKMKGLNQ